VVDAVAASGFNPAAVFTGFSQGVAMAFRAACDSSRAVAGTLSVGGDVPPELDTQALCRIPAAFVARGSRDEWYSPENWAADETRLREAGVDLSFFGFEGGHEWSAAVSAAAGTFLRRLTLSVR
jgi:predicted esterase